MIIIFCLFKVAELMKTSRKAINLETMFSLVDTDSPTRNVYDNGDTWAICGNLSFFFILMNIYDGYG